jgi:hypothetical protein
MKCANQIMQKGKLRFIYLEVSMLCALRKSHLNTQVIHLVVNKVLVEITPHAAVMVLYDVLVKTVQIIPTKFNTTCLLRFD